MNRKDIKKDHYYVLNDGRTVKVKSYLIEDGLLCGVSFYNYYPDSYTRLDFIARKATKEEAQKCEEEINARNKWLDERFDDIARQLKENGIL